MVLFNYTTKELTAKIVYYGPGLCGKTTNLQFIYDGLPSHVKKGKMLSLATKTDRTLFFDFLPIELGRIRGMRTRVQLYTVPGQVFYNSTRKLVLKGADGLVFVADSQQKMMESNIESYRNLEENLQEIGLKLEETPLVMQFNKRDLPNLGSVEEMNTLINRHNAPFYEAVATTGIGVEDTLKAITKLVLNHLAVKYHLGVPGSEKVEREDVSSPPRAQPVRPASPSPFSMHLQGTETPAPRGMEGASSDLGVEEREPKPPRRGLSLPASDDLSTASSREDLEILDLGEVMDADLPGATGSGTADSTIPASEDLSDLLEEIPEDGPEEILEELEDRPQAEVAASPAPRPVLPLGDRGRRPDPQSGTSSQAEVLRHSAPPTVGTDTSTTDPLGIMAARGAETPQTATIQVGAVTPGKQHQITVPLEMSVEGRKVRLQLRMTLTVSS